MDQFVEFGDWTFNVLGRGEPHRATGGLVTANFFPMLGAQPLLGRMLVPDDEAKAAPPVAVLTHAYWQRVFGSDPAVVGQTLDLTVKKAMIVGVLKPGSHYATQRTQDFYVNYAANDHYMSSSMQNEWPHRMTDGVRAARAGRDGRRARRRSCGRSPPRCTQDHPEAYPKSRGFDVVVTPWKDELTAKAKPTLVILLVTTVFVLIIACANVANLTLTRLVQREREMGDPRGARRAGRDAAAPAARGEPRAVGARRRAGPRTRRLGTESADRLHRAIHEPDRRDRARRHASSAFTLVVSTAMALLFAWAPRLTFMDDPVRAMSAGGGRTTGGRGRRRAQRALVVSQLAASFMLLIGAGLLMRSLMRLYAVEPGFDLANVLSLQAPDFAFRPATAPDSAGLQFNRDVLERVKARDVGKNAADGVGCAAGGIVSAAARIPDRRRRCRCARRAARGRSRASSAARTSRRSARR